MPKKLRMAEKNLRMAGVGAKIDEFKLSMNRAAEKAAPAARDIFKSALIRITFDDARKILTGGNTSATEYFKIENLGEPHHGRQTICRIGHGRDWGCSTIQATHWQHSGVALSGRTRSLDINGYVTGKTLGGVFHMLGEEEKKIRTNPVAQITPLLKEVFGGKH